MSDRPAARLLRAAVVVLVVLGCARHDGEWATVRELTPAFLTGEIAYDASLAADAQGHVALTWVTGDSTGQDLWLAISADSGSTFSLPVRVNPVHGSVVSFAECRPSAALGGAGELLIAWSERRKEFRSVADLAVRASADGGRTLSPPAIVNDDVADGRPAFHGFASLVALPDGEWFAAWIDGRERFAAADSAGHASIFCAVSRDGGQSWSDNRPLSSHACARCRVTALAQPDGAIAVVYRSMKGGVRDPSLAMTRDRGVSVALDTVLAADGWRAPTCPIEGPAAIAEPTGGGRVVWYTAVGEAGAWYSPWRAGIGAAGIRRALSDSLVAGRHPQIARVGDALLVAVEGTARDSGGSAIGVRALEADGTLSPWLPLGADARAAALVATGEHAALVCWTERGDLGPRVRVARVMRQVR